MVKSWGRRGSDNKPYQKSDMANVASDLRSNQKDLEKDLRGTRNHILGLSNEVDGLERKLKISKGYEDHSKKHLRTIKGKLGTEKEVKTLEKRLKKNEEDMDRYKKNIKIKKELITGWQKEVTRIQRKLDVVHTGLGKAHSQPPTRR